MDAIEAGTVGTVIIAHKDRLTRFGYKWFEQFCQRHACDTVVLNQEHLSPEEELVQDLLTITHVFSARLYGLRHYRKNFRRHWMPTLAHKIRLNPTPEQVTYFKQACGTARFVWNWALAEGNRQWQAGGHPNAGALKKQFNAIKYTTFPWLKDIHRDAHSQPFTDLATAWQRLWTHQNQRPVFKRKRKTRDSFYVANDKFRLQGLRVRLPKIGWVAMQEPLRWKLLTSAIALIAKAKYGSVRAKNWG